MNLISRMMILGVVAMATIFIGAKFCSAQMPSDAPSFSLKDAKGTIYDLSKMKHKPLMMIYFFETDQPSMVEELLVLDRLTKKYREADLTVWGITRSSKSDVMTFLKKTNISFPILLDNSNVSDLYNAKNRLPKVYIMGPDLKIIDYMMGSSHRAQKLLVQLAKRKLEQHQDELAAKLSDDVLRNNPTNENALATRGNAAAEMNNLKQAEKAAKELIAKKGPSEIAGKEILAKVYIRQGKINEALKIIKEVVKKAPNKSWPHILKGNILYEKGKLKEAQAEYDAASKKLSDEAHYIALANRKIARIDLQNGNTKRARKHAIIAEKLSPHDLENTTLVGETFEKEGRLDEAWKAYHEVQSIDSKNFIAENLAKRAWEMLKFKKDAARRNQRNQLVKMLADRFKQNNVAGAEKSKPEDTWTTSRPMVLAFLDLKESGGMAMREGFSTAMIYNLSKQLKDSGRIQVVDRDLIDQVLEELNLGSSDLANSKTRLKLGRLFAVKIFGTIELHNLPGSTLLSLRLIDVETSKIRDLIDGSIGSGTSVKKELYRLNREILTSIIKNYPLQGYVAEAGGTSAKVIINIGPDVGVVLGTKFDVIQDQPPIEYKGKTLHRKPKKIAQIKVTGLEKEFCYGQIVNADPDIRVKKDDKVKETIKFDEM
jgi:peroxiredoxin/Flp pilus assembly protein TadD